MSGKNSGFFLTAIWLPGWSHSLDVNHCIFYFRSKGHQEPLNEIGSLSPAKHLVGFEPGTFQFLLQRLNPLGHSPQKF